MCTWITISMLSSSSSNSVSALTDEKVILNWLFFLTIYTQLQHEHLYIKYGTPSEMKYKQKGKLEMLSM